MQPSTQEILKLGFRLAAIDSQQRGLQVSFKWTCEQLIGMTPSTPESDAYLNSLLSITQQPTSDLTMLGQALMSQGEYQRCAHLMRRNGPPKTNIDLYIAAYALYMAGEKVKTQKLSEVTRSKEEKTLPSETSTSKAQHQVAKNPYLKDLFQELYPLYRDFHQLMQCSTYSTQSSSGTSMDGFLMFLFAIVVRDLGNQGDGPPALTQALFNSVDLPDSVSGRGLGEFNTSTDAANEQNVLPSFVILLLYSLHLYPWNWSCWLELIQAYVSEGTNIIRDQDDSDPPTTWDSVAAALPVAYFVPHVSLAVPADIWPTVWRIGGQVMHCCFLTQLYLEQQRGDQALATLDSLVSVFPDSQVVASQVALAHYSLRDYDRAQDVFETMRESDPYRLDHIDTFSNILYVKERKAELSHLAHAVVQIDKLRPETCCVVGNYYSLKALHERAILYFQRALRLNRTFLSAWTLMGHEYVELRNTPAAIEAYRHAVEVSAADYRAWYGLGQTYEMLHLYQYALYYYKKAAALRPSDSRMWCAVGNCFSRLGMRSDAILALDRAVSSGDGEGIATRELARLYRESGQMAKAAECFRQHLRATGGVGGSGQGGPGLRGSGNVDMSLTHSVLTPEDDNDPLSQYLAVSVVIDSERAEALLFLASYYRDIGDLKLAEAYGTRLMDYVGPEGDAARALLREVRSVGVVLANGARIGTRPRS